jgi:predicted nucleic acid-binding protein
LLNKRKLYVTLLPTTIAWLKKRGNASALIDYMVENAMKGLFTPNILEELEALKAENQSLKKRVQEVYQLRVLSEKIEGKVNGYKSNNFSKGIEEFKEIVKRMKL